jgi:hypothetical protein
MLKAVEKKIRKYLYYISINRICCSSVSIKNSNTLYIFYLMYLIIIFTALTVISIITVISLVIEKEFEIDS